MSSFYLFIQMQTSKYKTIQSVGEGLYKEKGSKFYAFAFPVTTLDQIKIHISKLRKEHYQAVHVCSAYRLGSDKTVFKANDDGEPSNSAGPPILGQIKSFDLTNILIAVVRYYGGVNLGVGGLIHAYKTASKTAIESCQIIEKEDFKTIELLFQYEQLSFVMQQIKLADAKIVKQETTTICSMFIELPVSNIGFENKIIDQNIHLSEEKQIQITNHGISK